MKIDLIYFYKNLFSLKDKLKYVDAFKKKLIEKIEKEFSALNIELAYLQKNNTEFSFLRNERVITFDSKNIEGYFEFYNDNLFWINQKLIDIKIQPNEGVYGIKKFFERDNNILDIKPIESEHLLIELVVQKENCNQENTIFLFKKIMKILNKIIENSKREIKYSNISNFLNWEKINKYSDLKKKFPKYNLNDILKAFLSENQNISILFDKEMKDMKEILNEEIKFDFIQNNLMNTLYFLAYNKNSIFNSVVLKISERPTIEVIKKQISFIGGDFLNMKKIQKYINSNIYSYVIDLNLSAFFSFLFSEFSFLESSHCPGNSKLEKEYSNLKIKIF